MYSFQRPKPKSKPSSTTGASEYPPQQQLQPQQQFMPQPQILQTEVQPTQAQPTMLQSIANDSGTPLTGGGSEYGELEETLNHPSEWMAGVASHPTPPFPYHRGGTGELPQ